MTLYEMTENAKILYEMLNNQEIDEETVNDTIESMSTGIKLEDYCKVIKNLKADAEIYKTEAERLKRKQATAENSIKCLQQRMLDFMQATGKSKEKAGVFDIRVSESKAVNIVDVEALPKEFLIAQPAKIDKANIKNLLLAGEAVSGAELQINRNLQIK